MKFSLHFLPLVIPISFTPRIWMYTNKMCLSYDESEIYFLSFHKLNYSYQSNDYDWQFIQNVIINIYLVLPSFSPRSPLVLPSFSPRFPLVLPSSPLVFPPHFTCFLVLRLWLLLRRAVTLPYRLMDDKDKIWRKEMCKYERGGKGLDAPGGGRFTRRVEIQLDIRRICYMS